MKSYQLGLYEKAMPDSLTWKQKLESAKAAGFDYVEISIDETEQKLARLDMSKSERLLIVDLMYATGIPIRSLCLSAHRKFSLGNDDPALERKGLEIMEKAICLADDLGLRTIQLAGYDVYYKKSSDATRKRFRTNLEKVTQMASSAGIMMGFETMETEFMNTVEKAMKYVNFNQSPYLKIYPDAGNITSAAHMYNKEVLEDIEKGRGNIIAVHLKETKPGIFREVPFGAGHVDFDSIIEKAWNLGVRRYVTEMWYMGNDEWKKDISSVNKMIRKKLDIQEGR